MTWLHGQEEQEYIIEAVVFDFREGVTIIDKDGKEIKLSAIDSIHFGEDLSITPTNITRERGTFEFTELVRASIEIDTQGGEYWRVLELRKYTEESSTTAASFIMWKPGDMIRKLLGLFGRGGKQYSDICKITWNPHNGRLTLVPCSGGLIDFKNIDTILIECSELGVDTLVQLATPQTVRLVAPKNKPFNVEIQENTCIVR